LQRFSEDAIVNKNGSNLISLCKSFNFKIVNGRFGADKGVGRYTCHTPRGDSLVDYVLVSDTLIPQISNFEVDTLDQTLSDVHSALHTSVSYNPHAPQPTAQSVNTPDNPVPTESRPTYREKWKSGIDETFSQSFNEDSVSHLLDSLHRLNGENINQDDIDSVTNQMVDIFIKSAQKAGLCKENRKSKPKKQENLL
jgi:hypothetical protein